MLSTLELRHLIERSFLPMYCACSVTADNCLTVRIYGPDTGRIDLFASGISCAELNCNRAIENLLTTLRSDLNAHTEQLWLERNH
ncbi:DUF1652 domain-containing protein [Pseudomonas akapageensis]|uniref:DUF1652 domain-containing protein n=1 Tax=Pseudomonas akapageensis TaxID=2609961 RepID=UPI00140CAE50|nr:DUF1652 domain-containing protein [Pseudomonas akapageensis]